MGVSQPLVVGVSQHLQVGVLVVPFVECRAAAAGQGVGHVADVTLWEGDGVCHSKEGDEG